MRMVQILGTFFNLYINKRGKKFRGPDVFSFDARLAGHKRAASCILFDAPRIASRRRLPQLTQICLNVYFAYLCARRLHLIRARGGGCAFLSPFFFVQHEGYAKTLVASELCECQWARTLRSSAGYEWLLSED